MTWKSKNGPEILFQDKDLEDKVSIRFPMVYFLILEKTRI